MINGTIAISNSLKINPLFRGGDNMPSRTAIDIPVEQWNTFKPFSLPTGSFADTEAAKAIAGALALTLKERFGATRVVLFGSLATNDFVQWSDIDLAVWGIGAHCFYKAVAFTSGMTPLFKVDLVDADDCSSSLLESIKRYGVEL